MKPARASTRIRKSIPSRKKACQECTKSKARCDLERPACLRCVTRGRECRYPHEILSPPNTGTSQQSDSVFHSRTVNHSPNISTPLSLPTTLIESSNSSSVLEFSVGSQAPHPSRALPGRPERHDADTCLDFLNLDLVPLTDAEKIRDRWLQNYLPAPDQIPKAFHPHTLQYISCVLRTYPKQMISGSRIPPFIHPLQLSGQNVPVALANCYSLVRLWEHRAPGSEAIVATTIQQEMERLVQDNQNTTDFDRLAAFQAYLIYSMIAYFTPIHGMTLINDSSMITLQEMASRTAQNGLISMGEINRTTPRWESWIIASAKRRAIFTLYLFTSVYNADHSVPNFIAYELAGVYAPDMKELWEAKSRAEWERQYKRYLSVWEDGPLLISEMWWSPETGSTERRNRIDRWVQGVDEFGMMLFGVCSHIHGC
ncbi:C6 finger domain protein [Aspergillus sclerotialis]|uniref:C6 finger domain protein n=1 Tax=Aspergillus sclerotialis TaxID=2070753 RepID=A0A3A2ZUH0_9EURO|nr:C6 finger domain protein [Aspergillus sclerotialis]